MKRVHEGKYVEDRTVTLDGKQVTGEFEVFRVQIPDPKNPGKTTDSPFWSWRCSKLGIVPREVFETKMDAIDDMERSLTIGFKTLPIKSVMLNLLPKQ